MTAPNDSSLPAPRARDTCSSVNVAPPVITSRNVPKSLQPVINNWLAQGKEFYLGPENIFLFDSHRIQYHSNPDIPAAPGSWCFDNRRQPDGIPALSRKQVQDIAMELAKQHKPFKWTICLDYHCNYDCPMCPYHGSGYEEEEEFKQYWEKHGNQRRVVTQAEAFRLVDILKENGIRILSIQSSGELFLYPFWKEVAAYAQQRGMQLWSITNGSLLDEERCRTLRGLGFTDMRVSLDALSYEVYAKVRSRKRDYYARATAAPHLLTKHGIKTNVHFVRQEQNLSEVDAFLAYWKTTAVDSISIANQFVYSEEGCANKIAANEQKKDYIHGLCSKYGNFSSWNDGTIIPCCGATPVYTDGDTHGLPRLKLGENDFNDVLRTLNQLMSDVHSPFTKICAKCSLYTLYSTEQCVDGWKVNINPERETWTRG